MDDALPCRCRCRVLLIIRREASRCGAERAVSGPLLWWRRSSRLAGGGAVSAGGWRWIDGRQI